MAEAAARCLRDGRLDGEHAPALAVEGSLQCCPLAARIMLHITAAVASHAAAGKEQARGLVVVAFDRSPEVYLDFMWRRGLDPKYTRSMCSDIGLLFRPTWMEAEDSKCTAARGQWKAVPNKQREHHRFQKREGC